MTNEDKVNTFWYQKRVTKLFAFKAVINKTTNNTNLHEDTSVNILNQFLLKNNKYHKHYNTYKRQFEFLLNTNKKNFSKQKKLFLKEKPVLFSKPEKIVKIEKSDLFYKPIENLNDLVPKIHKFKEEGKICIFCDKSYENLQSHYRNELEKMAEKNKIEVCIFIDVDCPFYGKLEFKISLLDKICDLKKEIFKKTEIEIEKQVIKNDGIELNDNDFVVEEELTLCLKKEK